MKKTIVIILVSLFFFISCGDVYRGFETVSSMKWYKKDKKTFDVEIKEDGTYDLIIALRYPTGFQYKNVKLKISETSPTGETIINEFKLNIIDKNKKYKGEPAGDLWDLEEIFAPAKNIEKGKYKYVIEHDSKTNPLLNVMDIGLIIRKSEK